MQRKIKFICNVVKWFDKINGNTYHSVKITRCKDSKVLVDKYPYTYGYGEQYKYTALNLMLNNKWIPKKYNKDNYYLFERENNYPILWNVTEGKKREMILNGSI
jgi:hypothetical protein